ncbi:MAG: ABC transporter substrate-binding protein [Clostridia bacterium]|nr:ABC transporter substrate-binding protein [Clostridia bacterium]
MKKTFTKVLAVVLALCMVVVCFSACGSKKDGGDSTASDTFKIGSIGPLTGDNAVYGKAVQYGAELAVKEINANGGINGKQVEFRMGDDEADAEKSVNAYNDLKDWGMQILAGTVTTGACLAVVDKTKADNMFQLTPSASGADVIKNDNVFQVCFTDPNQGIASADYIADNNIAKKVAVIYNSADAYSTGIYNTFKSEAAVKGLEIVAAEAFTADTTDFSSQLNAAKNSGAELVFLPIYAAVAASILKQADTMGFKTTFFGCDGLDGILSIENFDAKLAEGTMLLTPFAADAKDEKTQNFVKAYNEAGYDKANLNQFAADAYDMIYVIKAAAEKANVTPDMSVSDICNAMKSAMTQIQVDGVTGLQMQWKATGEVNKAPKAVKIVSGAYVAMD